MQNYPKISVTIINWNKAEDTSKCIDSLKKSNYPNFDVFVVDNGSIGNDAEILEGRYGKYATIIKNKENLGFAGGHNVAIKHELDKENPPDFIFLLNNDAEVDPNCFDACVKTVRLSNAGIVGAIINRTRDGKVLSNVSPLINEFFGFKVATTKIVPPSEPFWEVERVQGAAMMISRKLLEQSIKERGFYLKEDYFLYWEETEFCCYARTCGYKVVIARDAIVSHYDAKSTGHDSPLTYYYFTRNRVFLANKVLPWHLKILFNLWYAPTRIFRAFQSACKGNTKVSFAILQGFIDGYINKRGKWKNHKG